MSGSPDSLQQYLGGFPDSSQQQKRFLRNARMAMSRYTAKAVAGMDGLVTQTKEMCYTGSRNSSVRLRSSPPRIMTKISRRPLAQPNQPLQGSAAERKLDIGFV